MRWTKHVFIGLASLVLAAAAWAQAPAALDPAASLAGTVEAGFGKGDAGPFLAAVDPDAFTARALAGLSATQQDRDRHARALETLAKNIVAAVKEGGTYRLLGVRQADSGHRARFRLVTSAGGFNYHDVLITQRGGAARIDDLHIAASGEWLSETLRRVWLMAEALAGPGGPTTLALSDRALVQAAKQIQDFSDKAGSGKAAEALAVYETLPAEVRRTKPFHIMAILSAQNIGAPVHLRLVDEFIKAYPADPALDIILVDYYFARKEFDLLLGCLANLDRGVGGDGYLRTLSAATYTMKGDTAAAKKTLGEAIAIEPTLPNPYWALIEIHLAEKNWSATAQVLEQIASKAGVALNDLTSVPAFAEFVKSKAYADWMKARRR